MKKVLGGLVIVVTIGIILNAAGLGEQPSTVGDPQPILTATPAPESCVTGTQLRARMLATGIAEESETDGRIEVVVFGEGEDLHLTWGEFVKSTNVAARQACS